MQADTDSPISDCRVCDQVNNANHYLFITVNSVEKVDFRRWTKTESRKCLFLQNLHTVIWSDVLSPTQHRMDLSFPLEQLKEALLELLTIRVSGSWTSLLFSSLHA